VSYASVISANLLLASGDGFLSGCHCFANLKYAVFISFSSEFLSTPKISYKSFLGV